MEDIVALFIPIGICVVLPIMIVWLVSRISINKDNRRTETLIEAIKNNANIDADKLIEDLKKDKPTPWQELRKYLRVGSILTLTGIGLGAASFTMNDATDEYMLIIVASIICLAIGIGNLITFAFNRTTIDKECEVRDKE